MICRLLNRSILIWVEGDGVKRTVTREVTGVTKIGYGKTRLYVRRNIVLKPVVSVSIESQIDRMSQLPKFYLVEVV